MTGKFIALEGGEGAGKDTQIDLLKAKLPSEQFVFTREPGGTEIGERIRSVLLSDEWPNMNAETELMLFVGARAQLLRQVVVPALEAGRHVISNRFGLSTVAYQIYGRQRQSWLPLLQQINELALGDLQPDLYVFLDVPPELGLERTHGRADNNRLDREKLEFHQRVYQGFHQALPEYPHQVIDGTRPIEEISTEIFEVIINLTEEESGYEDKS